MQAGDPISASVRLRGRYVIVVKVRVRATLGLGQFVSDDLWIELGLTVFVTSRRHRQTNFAQALKETNRFAQSRVRVRVRVRMLF